MANLAQRLTLLEKAQRRRLPHWAPLVIYRQDGESREQALQRAKREDGQPVILVEYAPPHQEAQL